MLRAALIWACLALPAAAQDVHTRLQTAFDGWLEAQGTTGALATAVQTGGTWTIEGGGAPRELASVAKSITATCALTLVGEGVLQWSDRVSDRLGKGPNVTVAQLVTHASGLVRDSTQAAMPLWLDRPVAAAGHNASAVLDIVEERGATQGASYQYAYNNENYALLALMIEAATGTTFEAACWPRLNLDNAVAISARTGAFAPWGGMTASPEGYMHFLLRHFGPGAAVAQDPFELPQISMGGGAHYGLGMVFRRFGDGHNFWHFGSLCFDSRLNAGSFAVIWEGKVSAVAFYDACVDWDAMFALDAALAGAVYGGARQ